MLLSSTAGNRSVKERRRHSVGSVTSSIPDVLSVNLAVDNLVLSQNLQGSLSASFMQGNAAMQCSQNGFLRTVELGKDRAESTDTTDLQANALQTSCPIFGAGGMAMQCAKH